MPILTTQDRLQTTIAGKYRLERVLGEGGMGVVYAGHHLKLDLPVAVKFLHPQYSRSQDVVERFLREARATSRLVHPNVVQVRDVDIAEDDGSVYMVLELLSGLSLADHIEREQVLSVDETLSIILPVADALIAAHGLGIVHRDIKPDNVFLSRAHGKTTPKVLDFGIAKLAGGGSSPSATATGAVMGTALYMAPEQAMGRTREVGPVSDVWSTAVMTYECLTGGYPFDIEFTPEMNAMAVMMSSITAPIVPLAAKRPELTAMSAVLARALERESGKRTPTMQAFADELRAAASGVAPEVKQSRVLSRPPAPRGDTTGPLKAPEPDPVAALSDAARMQRVKLATDPLAHTMMPQTHIGTESPSVAPAVVTPTPTATAARPSEALSASQIAVLPTRRINPYVIGGGVALVLGVLVIGAMSMGGAETPEALVTTAPPIPEVVPTAVTPTPLVAAPPLVVAPAVPPAVPPEALPEVAGPDVAEIAPPEVVGPTPSGRDHGRHRGGATAEAGTGGSTAPGGTAVAAPERTEEPAEARVERTERVTPPETTTGTAHRAGGLSSEEF
jgi:serine/threonine-protein kinase